MDLELIVSGIVIGLAVAAPLGPVNLLVMRSAARRGVIGGLAAGSGAMLADGFYAFVAAYGVRSIERFIIGYAAPLQFLAGLLLAGFGIYLARQHMAGDALMANNEPVTAAQLSRKFATAFTLTIANPGALFGMLAMFATLGGVLKLGLAPWRPPIAVVGVVAGGMLWWLAVSTLVSWLRSRLTAAAFDRFHRWGGIVIAAFGFVLLLDLLA